MYRLAQSWLLLAFILIITACTTITPSPATSTPAPSTTPFVDDAPMPTSPTGGDAYPAPESDSAYPAPQSDWIGPAIGSQSSAGDPYPAPEEEEETAEGIRFTIDGPIHAGQTTVTGTAPENTFVILSDITYAGQTLGEGPSDETGRFSLTVSPLTEGNRVGLTISSLQGDQSMMEFVQEYYPFRGEGYIEVPNIGVFFDSLLVEP